MTEDVVGVLPLKITQILKIVTAELLHLFINKYSCASAVSKLLSQADKCRFSVEVG